MKHKSSLALTFSLFLFAAALSSNAQKAPMKFGKVDIADLQMTTYAADTTAPAVILCNYGYFRIQEINGFELQFTQMIRVKILKKEGLDFGSRVLRGNSKSDVKGITYNLENGKIVESKLKSESIFKERVTESNYRLRVAMPNVKEGSVYDIQITYEGLPSEWAFQENIPVRWSELIMEPSQYVEFRKNYYGFVPLTVSTDMRWVAQNVPAFKPEPFINSVSNYLSKFEIDLLRFTFPGNYKEFTTDWEAVNRRLNEHDNFGLTMQAALFLNSIASEIEAKYTSKEDIMRAAFEAVKIVKWNEQSRLYTTTNVLSFPFNKKIGNSADINLLLVQLLKKLDFVAYPVAMSTRDNGALRNYAPSLDRLNYVIACIKLDGKNYLLDATEEFIPMGLLPKRALNEHGRLIDSKFTEWVDITATRKNKVLIQGLLSIESNDILKGKFTYSKVDYAAFNLRKTYKGFNGQDEYLKDLEKDNPGLMIENYTVKDMDSIYKPVIEELDVKIKNRVNNLGNLLYINPMLFEQITENPFKVDERKYPVDFAYPIEKIYMLTLNIPEGYQVDQIPKPLLIKLPDNSASCIYQVNNLNNSVQIMFKFLINKPMFLATEYFQLKSFYDEVVKKQAELIVLKKI